MVKPIMLGKIVERRDQVRRGFLSPLSNRFLYLLQQVQVNKGPFLRERGMAYPLKLFATATYDEFISTLVAAGLLTFGLNAHGVTGCLPKLRPSPPPCGWSTGFIAVPRTVGRTPRQRAAPALPRTRSICSALPTSPRVARQSASTLRIFTRTQTQGDISTVTSNDLNVSTSGTSQLTAFTWFHFYVMNGRTNRDIAHRQGVACFDCSINARLNLVASFQAFSGPGCNGARRLCTEPARCSRSGSDRTQDVQQLPGYHLCCV